MFLSFLNQLQDFYEQHMAEAMNICTLIYSHESHCVLETE
jgi:hypothetical protein